jgi:hypothetical protein
VDRHLGIRPGKAVTEPLPDPAGQDLAGRVLEARDLVQVVVIQDERAGAERRPGGRRSPGPSRCEGRPHRRPAARPGSCGRAAGRTCGPRDVGQPVGGLEADGTLTISAFMAQLLTRSAVGSGMPASRKPRRRSCRHRSARSGGSGKDRVVAGVGEAVVEAQLGAALDDLGLAHLHQRRVDAEACPGPRRRLWWRRWPAPRRPGRRPGGSPGSPSSRGRWRRSRAQKRPPPRHSPRATERKTVLRAGT